MLRRNVGRLEIGAADRPAAGAASEAYRYDTRDPAVYGNRMGRYKTGRQLSFIEASLPTAAARIVDIGGGAGRLAIPLAHAGHELTVVDPSRQALDLLDGRAGSAVRTVQSDLMSFDPASSYDVVLLIDAIKYMFEISLVEAFSKARGLLAPGGMLVIAEINRDSWRNHVSERAGRRSGRPYNIASAAGYRAALAAAGFAIERERGLVWMPLPFNSDSRLVSIFARLERLLRLDAWVSQSPWLLISARSVDAAAPDAGRAHQRTTVGESARRA